MYESLSVYDKNSFSTIYITNLLYFLSKFHAAMQMHACQAWNMMLLKRPHIFTKTEYIDFSRKIVITMQIASFRNLNMRCRVSPLLLYTRRLSTTQVCASFLWKRGIWNFFPERRYVCLKSILEMCAEICVLICCLNW